jgi:hypothetical protein
MRLDLYYVLFPGLVVAEAQSSFTPAFHPERAFLTVVKTPNSSARGEFLAACLELWSV